MTRSGLEEGTEERSDARGVTRVAVALGSNRGDRIAALREAVERLTEVLVDLRVSPVYETVPIGSADQAEFLNACCIGWTGLEPRRLLKYLQESERRAGRERSGARWGARTLDLDLLLYGDLVLHTPDLTIPHPRMRERAFVLVPLADVAPTWLVPASEGHRSIKVEKLAREVKKTGIRGTDIEIDE